MAKTVPPDEVFELLRRCLAEPDAGASVGALGALAEFNRDGIGHTEVEVTEAADAWSMVSDLGALRVGRPPDAPTVVAFEGPTSRTDGWTQEIAVCLPAAAARMSRRTALTEIGPDTAALRPGDRGAILFDMGLGLAAVDVMIRTGNGALIETLRGFEGRSLLQPGSEAMAAIKLASPHRVFESRFARIEVYQRIGSTARGIPTPDGPHTHVLPGLLKTGRSHSANAPIPEGQVPGLSLYPTHAWRPEARTGRRRYSRARFRRSQTLIGAFAPDGYMETKRKVFEALGTGTPPERLDLPRSRVLRLAVRIALRQAMAAGAEASRIEPWRTRFDRASRSPEATTAH